MSVRALQAADTLLALRLLAPRPFHNVFLEHLVRAGALATLPGFYGYLRRGELGGMLMVAPGGSTSLEVRDPAAFEGLARAAAEAPVTPRHIVGAEEVTRAFWEAFAPWAPPVVWERREPLYLLTRDSLRADAEGAAKPAIEEARATDLEAIVRNSAAQFREDLKQDRQAEDPPAFRARHEREIREGRWWVVREEGEVVFQVHVGPANRDTVQLGGVYTSPELRGRGRATRGMLAIVHRLLEKRPAVTLFCDESNRVARRVYERVGFRVLGWYRSWLLEQLDPE
ncbi:MAG: GNAT family N-acetyltransferase [Myxococcota bacterium]